MPAKSPVTLRCLAGALAATVFTLCSTSIATGGTAVTLPVEVVGGNGTTAAVIVDVPPQLAREVRSLWMQINGLSYSDMVSVQVNQGVWFPLNNATVDVAEPGRSYGGIGGGFSTLKVTLTLPADAVVEGPNTIRFRSFSRRRLISHAGQRKVA